MLDLFASSRIYVGISLSDGISTSLLEAMAMGAFPIQTSTACVDEWFADGVSGYRIDKEFLYDQLVERRIQEALAPDFHPDFPLSGLINTRLSKMHIAKAAREFYR
jgi:glycosyltransferase involved in cell wall biosynthesis